MAASKKVLSQGLKKDRAVSRAKLGSLRGMKIQPRTAQRYTHAVFHFLCWLSQFGFHLASTYDQLDTQVCEWLEYLWHSGESKGLAGDTLSGIQWLLQKRRILDGGWSLLEVWSRHELPARAPAMPPLVLLGIAGFALSRGALDVAALLLTGFACMLRSMEMFSICRNHIALAAQLTGAILLPDTKSGKRRGGLETACLSDRLAGWSISQTPYFAAA